MVKNGYTGQKGREVSEWVWTLKSEWPSGLGLIQSGNPSGGLVRHLRPKTHFPNRGSKDGGHRAVQVVEPVEAS